MQEFTTEEMRNASPSMFDAQNQKVDTAIQVLRQEAEARKPSMEAELLSAGAKFLEVEVKG